MVVTIISLLMLQSCTKELEALNYKPGTYTAEAQGHNGPVRVEVTCSESKIDSIKVVSHSETEGIADTVFSTIPEEIVKTQSLDVDGVSGATVAGNAVIAAVADAVRQAGGDPEKLQGKGHEATGNGTLPEEKVSCDVVVVGAGGAGLVAANAAIEAGYDVVLLEKLSYTGGGFTYVEGVFGVNSPIQKEAGVDLSVETLFKESMDFHHWLPNASLLKAFYNNAGDSIKWLMDRGVKFRGVITANPPDGNVAWHLFDGGKAGRLAVKNLTERIEKSPNGTILYETPGKALIIRDGKVCGVSAVKKDGGMLSVEARAVILATGGFSSNQALKEQYLRYPGYLNVGAGGREGDGLKMLSQVHADLIGMSAVLGAGLVMPIPISQQMGPDTKYPDILGAIYNEGLLTLSRQGMRFMNERLPIEYRSNATEQVGGTAFVVFDQKTVDEFIEKGQRFGFGIPRKLPKLQEGLDKALAEKNDWMFSADSLEGLSKQTGMPLENLEKSVADMNGYAAQGQDPEFYMEKKALFSIKEAPYYAVRVVLGMYATVGGSKVTEGLQVIDTDGNVVPGLYAIGLDTGGLYGDTYDMRIANGAASGFSVTSARLAVRDIQRWLKK
jgi:fumarate reductase flavoprotein subunit